MRFSRLRLNGFKSFVDPTDLAITDGLTGVVGPNGCGKSNLLEALRWVMGESRPSAVRGGGMEDVIFAGTASRAPRPWAEVSLLLEDAAGHAPAGVTDADTLEVARRIARATGSTYRINGREVRARDVDLLFADAATGARSPALVRQGQIAALIAAKPRARRRVLEDAAGVAGLHQRRHEAEVRLEATEANLARLEDAAAQMDAQLAALARQARQARRYREVAEALRAAEGALLWTRWRDADAARLDAEDALRAAVAAVADAERAARAAGASREAAEAALPAAREEKAVADAVLQRVAAARAALSERMGQAAETIRGLEARLAQVEATAAREADLSRDAEEAVARLAAEAVELAAPGDEAATAARARDAANAASEVLATREAALGAATEAAARQAAAHEGAVRDARAAIERSDRAARAVAAAAREIAATERATATAVARAEAAMRDRDAAAERAAACDARLVEVEAAGDRARADEARSRAADGAAQAEVAALEAEVETLEGLLAREAADGPTILDAITVTPGFEDAVAAALGPDADAPSEDWVELSPYGDAPPLTDGVQPLGEVAAGPTALSRRLASVGIVDDGTAMQGALRPGQVLVSRTGAAWRWDGLRRAAAPSAAGARLARVNRLSAQRDALEAARARHASVRARRTAADAAARAARDEEGAARAARRNADRQAAEAERAAATAAAARDRTDAAATAARDTRDRAAAEAVRASETAAKFEARRAATAPPDAARAALEAARMAVGVARADAMARAAEADAAAREAERRAARAGAVERDLAQWRGRLDGAGARTAALAEERAAAGDALVNARRVPDELAAQAAAMDRDARQAEHRAAAASDALSDAERIAGDAVAGERAGERAASDAREARARADARMEAALGAVEDAVARIRDALGTTPGALRGTLPDDLPQAGALEAEVAALRRRRDAIGPVNLRAEEDAAGLEAERAGLATERADLAQAVGELRSGIAGINREGRQRLLAAFDAVSAHFAQLFRHLFRGGEARLELVESDDPLEAGLEILCQPPGKRLASLSLLSGGEQTLCAMALIFAVFLSNPSPICVLDEVDAPLDDANVARFCDLLDAMTRRSDTRFVIITHHAVTMARMDRLYGVTMSELGVSQLVGVDLRAAEALVA